MSYYTTNLICPPTLEARAIVSVKVRGSVVGEVGGTTMGGGGGGAE